MNKIEITIFTPTYNRKKFLKKCFQSLLNQTDKNFRWLIIDDGSEDNTNLDVEKFKEKADFEIDYYIQKNGGKHRAHNNAIKKCKTNYFLILDSDDYLSNNAIEVLNKKIKEIDKMENISGIIGNRFYSDQTVNGVLMPNIKYASGVELYQKMNFEGDTLRMYKTKILKEFLFPEIENEKFVYENVVFDKIDKKYKMLVIHDKLYFGDYQIGGYTDKSSKLKLDNPFGYALSLKSSAECAVVLNKKINWTILYIIWCKKMKIKNSLKMYKNKFLYLLLYPVSCILTLFKYPVFFFKIFEVKK